MIDTFTFVFDLPINAFGITFSSTFANHDGDYLLTTDLGDVIASFFDPLFAGFSLGQFAGFIVSHPSTFLISNGLLSSAALKATLSRKTMISAYAGSKTGKAMMVATATADKAILVRSSQFLESI